MPDTTLKSAEEFPLPTLEEANDVRRQVYNEVFFAKLAGHGIVPTSEPEAIALLDMVEDAHKLGQTEAVKQANAKSSKILQLHGELKKTANAVLASPSPQERVQNATQLAHSCVTNPVLLKAAIAIGKNAAKAQQGQAAAV